MGYIFMGLGALILLLNGVASGNEPPETTRRVSLIAIAAIAIGIAIQVLLDNIK